MQLRTFLVAATIAATLGTIGCAPILAGAIVASSSGGGGGGSGRGAPAGGTPTSGVTIGPEGGSVTDRGVRIDVPPGAFTTPVTLSASFASSIVGPDETSVGRAVRLRPSMTFARGVTIELPWDSGLLPTGSSVNDVFVLWRDETTGLVTTLGARVDGDVVRLTVFDFGTFEPAVFTGVDVGASSMIVATGSVPADGVSAVGVVVTLVDVGGQPMPGRIVQLAFDGPNPFGSPSATTNALGVALFQLSSTTVGTFSTTARVPPRDVALNQRVSITFTALAAVDPNLSTIAVAPTTTPFVGERITLTVTARGSAGQLLVGRSVVATATGGGHAIASAPNTDASGVSAFVFVASVTGPKTITVVVGGTTLTQQPVIDSRPQPEPADADTTTVVASPTSVEADGTTSSTITVTVRAADGTPLVGRAVAVAASGTGQVITQPATTDQAGVATGTIASTVTGAKTITALVDGTITITQQPVVTFTIPAVDPDLSTIVVTPASSPFQGDTTTITVTARSRSGLALAGRTVVATASGSGHTFGTPPATGASGVSSFTFAASVTGPKTITVTVDGTTLTQQPIIDTQPAADPDTSTAVASPTSVAADGAATSTVTVTVRTAAGAPLAGRDVSFSASGAGQTIVQPGVTDANGVVTGTIASTVTGPKTISVYLVGGDVTLTQQPVVTFTPPPVDPDTSTITVSPSVIYVGLPNTATATVTARAASGLVLPGRSVVLAIDGPADVTQPSGPTNGSGVATGTISPTTVSVDRRVTATVDGVLLTARAPLSIENTPIDPARTTVVITPDVVPADGVSVATITVTARDVNGALAAGRSVTFSATPDPGPQPASGPVTTDQNGVATTTFSSSTPGTSILNVVVGSYTVTTARPPAVYFHGPNACLRFDGGDAIDLHSSTLETLGSQFTFEGWVKLASHRIDAFIFNRWRVAVEDKIFHVSSGHPSVGHAGPDVNLTAPTPLPLGRWTHIAGVMDGAGMRMYVDGRLVASTTITGDMKDASGSPRIGRYFRDGVFKDSLEGLLDELHLSRVARYTADFTPAKRFAPDVDTLLLMHFDEGTGVTTSDTSPARRTGNLAAGAEQPQWVLEEVLVPDAELTTAVLLLAKTTRPGATGQLLQVRVDNTGSAAATIQGASLTFDDPGYTSTRTDSVTSVAAGGQASLTFTVSVPAGAPLGPVNVDATLQAVDAGNGADVSLATATTPALWHVVDWLQLGGSGGTAGLSATNVTPSSSPSVTIDDTGAPLVAWAEGGLTSEVFVARWNGAAWAGLSGSTSAGGLSNTVGASTAPRIAMRTATAPVVAWEDDTSGALEVYLRSWTGSAWVELGGSATGAGVSGSGAASRAPALAVDASGNPMLAWQEDVAGNQEIHLRAWSGSAWVELGGSATGGGVSGTTGASTRPALGLTSTGSPIVAWLDDSAGMANVYAKTWSGTAWVELALSATGGGVTSTTGGVTSVDLAVSRDGLPTIAWADATTGTSEVYVATWSGTAWQGLAGSSTGGGLSATTADPSLTPRVALDAAGRPTVTWEEASGSASDVWVARWNGTAWVACSGSRSGGGVSTTAGVSRAPALALDAVGHPVLAWEDLTASAGAGEVLLRRYRGEYLVTFEAFETAAFRDRWVLNGDASHAGTNVVVCPNFTNRRGSMFYEDPLELSVYRARFRFQVGEADGLTLAMIRGTSPNLLGSEGGGMGVATLPGYCVEFDPWPNGQDISGNHVAFSETTNLSPLAQTDVIGFDMQNVTAQGEVLFDRGHVQVFLECQALAFPRTLVLDHTEPALTVFQGYLGFTAATGLVNGTHYLDDLLVIVDP